MKRLAPKIKRLRLPLALLIVLCWVRCVPIIEPQYIVKQITVTAYTACPEECDADYMTNASNTRVAIGQVAYNQAKFGTKIRLPFHFRDTFVVADRTHRRFSDRLDIYFGQGKEAKRAAYAWGKQRAWVAIEI